MEVEDLINVEKGKLFYSQKFMLWPKTWTSGQAIGERTWSSVDFSDDNSEDLPDNEKGVYAFLLHLELAGLTLDYLLYVGSTDGIRARYKNYIEEKKKVKRKHITLMLNKWPENLKFHYSTMQAGEDPVSVETLLWEAFQPPYNRKKPKGKILETYKAWK